MTTLGDRAVVTLVVKAIRADDGSEHRYRNIRLLARKGGSWTMEL